MAITRSFTRQELDSLGLPDNLSEERVLLNAFFAEHRWETENRLVFRSPDDEQIYEIFYRTPSTEMSEGSIDPWDDEPTVEATLVEQRTVFHQDWRPVGSPKRKDEVNIGIDEAIRQGLKCAICHQRIEYVEDTTGQWEHAEYDPDNPHAAVSLIWGTDPAPWSREGAE